MWGKIKDWLEIRIGLDALVTTYFKEFKMPRGAGFLSTLGFVALIAFIVQVITGMFLLLYYIPHPDHAFNSVQTISNEIPFGWLIRLIHNVGSNLIVAVIIIHLVHVIFRGSYKKPRELTWLTGALMFLLILLSCISGQLLPWNQTGYWSTTVISSIPALFPVVGDTVASFFRGGGSVSSLTLGRFFSFHVVILPFLILVFIGLHALLIRRQGLSASPLLESEEDKVTDTFKRASHPDGLPCFPHFSLKRLFMVFLYFSVVFFILTFLPNLFLPEGSNIPANPLKTPEFIKPPWYFLAQYQLIKSIPNEFVGISIQIVMVACLLFWPFFDAQEMERNILKRPVLLSVFSLLLFLWCALTFWGIY